MEDILNVITKIIITNLPEVIAICISLLALGFTALKDFILPWWNRPKFQFKYEEKEPFRRENTELHKKSDNDQREFDGYGTYLRFQVKNTGKSFGQNCRVQIYQLKNTQAFDKNYQGFPLRWASRPESEIEPLAGERLNIGIKETEFIDIAMVKDSSKYIHIKKYHNIPIGPNGKLEPTKYQIIIIFSGDNFKPYYLHFEINKKDSNDIHKVDLKLIKQTQNLKKITLN